MGQMDELIDLRHRQPCVQQAEKHTNSELSGRTSCNGDRIPNMPGPMWQPPDTCGY